MTPTTVSLSPPASDSEAPKAGSLSSQAPPGTASGEAALPVNAAAAAAAAAASKPATRDWKKLLLKYHLPLGLIFAVIAGLIVPGPGTELGEMSFSSVCISIIFFISGLKVDIDSLTRALKAYRAIIFGIASIMIFTPMTAFPLLGLKGIFGESDFGVGLAIFALMPTTVSSGIILTRDALGNWTLSLLLSVVTNLLAILVLPFTIGFVFDSSNMDVELDVVKMLTKLVLTILVPLLIGKGIAKFSARIHAFVARHGVALKLTSSFFLCMIPFMKCSKSADKILDVDIVDLLLLVLAGIGMHVLFLVFNHLSVRGCLRLPLPERIAVTLMGSQKTLAIAAAVIEFLPEGGEDKGFLIIACIVAHFVQIVIDAFLSASWAQQVERERASGELKEIEAENKDVEMGRRTDVLCEAEVVTAN
jgi:sodium/bile acid cotransporter 7